MTTSRLIISKLSCLHYHILTLALRHCHGDHNLSRSLHRHHGGYHLIRSIHRCRDNRNLSLSSCHSHLSRSHLSHSLSVSLPGFLLFLICIFVVLILTVLSLFECGVLPACRPFSRSLLFLFCRYRQRACFTLGSFVLVSVAMVTVLVPMLLLPQHGESARHFKIAT